MSDASSDTVVIPPRPVFLAKLAAAFALGFGIVALFTGGIEVGTIIMWAALVVFSWWLFRLKLSARGVSVAFGTAPWPKVELRQHRQRDLIVTPAPASWRERVGLTLVNYEADWRSGRIGDAMRRWRPDLLDVQR